MRGYLYRKAQNVTAPSPPDSRTVFERAVPADVSLLSATRAELRRWLTGLSVTDDDTDAIVLACSEAISNAIEHAYQGDPAGIVRVTARLTRGRIAIAVSDTGSWTAPPKVSHGELDWNSLERGRGLVLIRRLMDKCEVSTKRGTTVSMRRRVTIVAPRRTSAMGEYAG